MFQYGIFCNTKGNHFCKSETVASFMLYFELNFTHNILHIVDTRLFTLYKLSSLYSTYCKNFLTMGRMSKFNNFVLSCKNNFVVTDNSTTSYSRKTKLFSISFLSYLTYVINIYKVSTNTFVYSICKKNCCTTWGINLLIVMTLYNFNIKASLI